MTMNFVNDVFNVTYAARKSVVQVKSCQVSRQYKYQIVNTEQSLIDSQQFQQAFNQTDKHSTHILNRKMDREIMIHNAASSGQDDYHAKEDCGKVGGGESRDHPAQAGEVETSEDAHEDGTGDDEDCHRVRHQRDDQCHRGYHQTYQRHTHTNREPSE